MTGLRIVRRALGLLAVVALLLPGAGAREIGTERLHVALESEATAHCFLAIDAETCLVYWDTKGTDALGDDDLGNARFLTRVALVSDGFLGTRQEAELRLKEYTIGHSANHQLAAAWPVLNGSLPVLVREYATLESGTVDPDGSQGVAFVLHFPVPLPASLPDEIPVVGSVDLERQNTVWLGSEGASVGYSWDCGAYFDASMDWDTLCSYDGVRPLPPGMEGIQQDTDFAWDYPAIMTTCDALTEDPSPTYCVVTAPAHAQAVGLQQATKGATPNVTLGTGGLQEVAVDLASDDEVRGDVSVRTGQAAYRLLGASAWSPPTLRHPPEAPPARVDSSRAAPSALPGGKEPGGLTPLATSSIQTPSSAASWLPFATVAAFAGGTLLLLLAAFLLYHRTRQDATLENQNRLRIYEAIRDEPGIRAGTLRTRLGLGYQTVLWHLKILEEFHMVEGLGEGQRRFFVNGGSFNAQEKRAIMITSTPAARAIVDLIRERGETPFSALSGALDISNSTASETVGRLEQAGLLVKRRVNGRLLVGPGPVQPGSRSFASGNFRESFA